jgi:MFS family permease
MPPQGGIGRPGLRATLDGLRYIRSRPAVLAVLLADLDATVLAMPVALFPAINAARFGGSPQTLGLLSAGLAAGGLAGSVLSGPAGRVSRKARAMLFTVAVWGAALAVFGLAHTLWLALLMLALASAADTTGVIFRGSIVQLATPDRLRGRVTAVDYVVGAGGPALGNVRAGAVAELTSPGFSAVSGGLAAIAGAVVIRLVFPALARYDGSAEPAASGPNPDPGTASAT